MEVKHKVVVIPGLGDRTQLLEFAAAHWCWWGLEPVVYPIGWHDGEAFGVKLKKQTALIDRLVKDGDRVTLVGASADGSAVLNAFAGRRNKIHRVVNVCGRLKTGSETGYRSFDLKTASSPAFGESVRRCEDKIKTLASADRKKIMTILPRLGDELVPAETTMVEDAEYCATNR